MPSKNQILELKILKNQLLFGLLKKIRYSAVKVRQPLWNAYLRFNFPIPNLQPKHSQWPKLENRRLFMKYRQSGFHPQSDSGENLPRLLRILAESQVAKRGYSKVLTSRLLCLSEIKRLAPPIDQRFFQLLFSLKQLIIAYW